MLLLHVPQKPDHRRSKRAPLLEAGAVCAEDGRTEEAARGHELEHAALVVAERRVAPAFHRQAEKGAQPGQVCLEQHRAGGAEVVHVCAGRRLVRVYVHP